MNVSLRCLIVLVCFCCIFFATYKVQAAPPALTVRDSFHFGECIHLGQAGNANYGSGPDVEMKLSQLGITSTRDDLSWSILEASSLRTIPQAQHKLAYSLNNIRARPVLILTGSPSRFPQGEPFTDQERKLYVDYAQHAASILKDKNPIFEIWNEWNLAAARDPKRGTAENYVALAKAVYPAIKKIMPNGVVLAGAVGNDFDWSWTLKAVDLGLMNSADGLSVHTYNHCAKKDERTGDRVMDRLVQLHEKLSKAHPDKSIPLYVTEYGWPTQDKSCGGVPEETAAANMAQLLLSAPSYPWLKGLWHYELLDERLNLQVPENRENHFGLYRVDGSLKPAGCVAKAVWEFIADQKVIERRELAPHLNMLIYGNGDKRRVAVWQSEGGAVHRLILPKEARGVAICGYPAVQGGQKTAIGPMPLLSEVPAAQLSAVRVE